MYRRSVVLVAAFLALVIGAAGLVYFLENPDGPEVTAKLNVPVLDDSMATPESIVATVDASNLFAFDLYDRYSAGEDNVFYSPYSISTALSMTYEGARATTAEEMQSVFHWSEDDDVRRPGAAKVFNILNGKNRSYTLHTANALWMQEGYPFKEDYVDTVEDYYGGEPNMIDFGDAVNAAEIINGWVEERTNDKIKDLLSPNMLVDARLVLTNAIYFKGDWLKMFDKELTSPSEFHVSPQETVEIEMMNVKEGYFGYVDTGDAQILKLPYEGKDLSMIIVLPKPGDIHEFENGFSLEDYRSWLDVLESTRLDVYLPRFKFETKYMMGKDLAEMGMPTAFTGSADFSGMSDGGLFIGHVVHQAYIDVNEEGTEAAAATGVVMVESMSEVFRADHPFIFTIQDGDTGLILFMGRVMDPS
jgi:serpin B